MGERAEERERGPRTKSDRLWTPMFVGIILCSLFSFLVGQGSNAGTSVYLESVGSSVALAGMGALFFSVAAAVTRVFSGPIVDRRGRMIVVSVGAVIMVLGCVGPLLANEGPLLIFWRVLQGVGFSAATTALATAAADVLPSRRLSEGISYYGLGQALAMAVGPALAITLASSPQPRSLYYCITAFAVIVLVLSLVLRYEKRPLKLPETCSYRQRYEEGRLGDAAIAQAEEAEAARARGGRFARLLDSVFEPGAVPAAAVIFFISSAFGFGIFFIGTFGHSLGISDPGVFFTCAAVVTVAVRLGSGRLMNSAPPFVLLSVGVAGGFVAFVLLFACSLHVIQGDAANILFYLAGVPYGLCMGISIPVNQAMAVKMSPEARWGAANGLFMLAVDVSCGAFSALWGFISSALGYSVTLGAVMVLLVVALLVARLVYPREGKA